jgi:GT2 family glycosyltransferase
MIDRPILVAICTCNRGDLVRTTVASVLANQNAPFQLLILDQSDTEVTREALSLYAADPRVHLLALPTKGLGIARNVAIRHALERQCASVIFTDDDCTVPSSWIEEMERVAAADPRIAVVFSNVLPGEFDASAGIIPMYKRQGTQVFRTLSERRRSRAIGASMWVRPQIVEQLGFFDELLGAGGKFCSCEDWDLADRAILAGFQVVETDATHVIHDGFRTFAQVAQLMQRDWTGIGASAAKLARCNPRFLQLVLGRYLDLAWVPFLRSFAQGKPRGLKAVVAFIVGFSKGIVCPVDRRRMVFCHDE